MAVDVQELLAIVEEQIDCCWPQILKQEKIMWSNYGFYFQGLCTHSVVPEDGNPIAPDFPIHCVNDQSISWGTFLFCFSCIPPETICALSISLYQYPNKQPGFTACFETRLNGILYRKQLAYGPESDRESHDWLTVNETILSLGEGDD